jgi:hypothetical protein
VTDERDAREQREDEEDRPDRKRLSQVITERMKELDIRSPEQLATMAGVSLPYARAMRNGTGKSNFSFEALSGVARALDWPDAYLYNIFYKRPDKDYVSPSMVDLVRQTIIAEIAPVKDAISEVRADISTVSENFAVFLATGGQHPGGN